VDPSRSGPDPLSAKVSAFQQLTRAVCVHPYVFSVAHHAGRDQPNLELKTGNWKRVT
jgi:hypothetical protein